MKLAVIGSGPAGTAAALALSARGLKPDLIDIGEQLEEERRLLVATLTGKPRSEWPPATVAAISENRTVSARGVPRKLSFGSDYIYARERSYGRVEASGVGYLPTHAAGGYSVAWGGALLPMHADDMTAWPIGRHDLENHYRSIAAALPITGEFDPLERAFPAFREELGEVRLPTPLRVLLSRLRRKGADSGPHHCIGRARLALRDSGRHACVDCGLCLTGCPVGAIYSTCDTLGSLEQAGKLRCYNGRAVLSLAEGVGSVSVELFDTERRTVERVDYDYVFLAAGAVNSSRILLNSKQLFDVDALLRDSQKFVMPAVAAMRVGRRGREDAPSLPGLFVELKLPGHSAHWFHAQISAVNDLLLRRFGIDPFAPTPPHKRPLRAMLDRVLILWCGMHSDHSSAIALRIERDDRNAMPTVHLSPVPNPASARYLAHFQRALGRLLRPARAFVVQAAAEIGMPGEGGHVGGTFPMRCEPRSLLETDPLGRPFGWRRVCVVDGACLPSVPATTPTFTIMANAHRIASCLQIAGSR